MKSIMISIKPKYCAKIMNGEKTIEVRKNKSLANAIQKLIAENGYADIYVYCTKEEGLYISANGRRFGTYKDFIYFDKEKAHDKSGKVLFKFRCYKVEEITPQMWTPEIEHDVLGKSCLKEHELFDYVCSYDGTEDKPFYVIHISDLEIFDKPKELSEFKPYTCNKCDLQLCSYCNIRPLTKAPQNFCYVEVE